MLTIISIPKPFAGLAAVQQRNAIQSWLHLQPESQIILFGDDPSVIAAASELGVESTTGIKCNEFGTPYLDSVFSKAYSLAKWPILCYVNSDIILMDDLTEALATIKLKKYLAVGQRTNLDFTDAIDFSELGWQACLLELCAKTGELYTNMGIDYFIFPKTSDLHLLPPFLVGRPSWDNWFIFNALKLRVPIIDLTRVCQVIHQNHSYAHIPHGRGNSWGGPESVRNKELYHQIVGNKYLFNISDATHVLTQNGLSPVVSATDLFHRLQTSAIYKPTLRPLAKLVKALYLQTHRSQVNLDN